MPFTNAILYDHGINPVVAGVEITNIVIEMHNGADSGLWYHVATINTDNNTINWGPSTQWTGADHNTIADSPSVSVSEDCIVAEAHSYQDLLNNEIDDGSIWTTIGIADAAANSIAWGSSQQIDSHAYYPSISISRDGKTVVIVYQHDLNGGALWYHVGTVDSANKSINWGPGYYYTQGFTPSISMDELGNIIEVHNSYQNNTELWYVVGKLDAANLTVNWGTTIGFNSAEKFFPRVALSNANGTDAGWALVVFPGQSNSGDLWWDGGNLNPTTLTATWDPSYKYQNSGAEPAFAFVYNRLMLEVHQSRYSLGYWELWYELEQ